MSVINHTPFPAIAFRQYNLRGEMNGVVSVVGAFQLAENAPLRPLKDQPALVLTDSYIGDPHKTVQVMQGALTPFKPGTDITLIGNSYAPDETPARSWICGLKVGAYEKKLQVTGPRKWQPQLHGSRLGHWQLSLPEEVLSVPLSWTHAWGGPLPHKTDEEADVHRLNPLGHGIVDLEHFDPRAPIAAPQIEDPHDPIREWNRDYTPQGFGLISPWWQPRQQYAGTYDDNWANVRHPLLPEDFDFRFYQAAPEGLIATPYLKGDEEIGLLNLTPPNGLLKSRLPDIRLAMRLLRGEDYKYARLVLDGVHFDLRPAVKRVYLTWRVGFPWADGKGMPELAMLA